MAPQKVGSRDIALLQNYPNPFNPETWIPYVLAKDQKRVTIEIYTATGQLVRRLNLGDKRVSAYLSKERAAYWDGKNETGEPVASGVYFYNLRADGVALGSRRLVILR